MKGRRNVVPAPRCPRCGAATYPVRRERADTWNTWRWRWHCRACGAETTTPDDDGGGGDEG